MTNELGFRQIFYSSTHKMLGAVSSMVIDFLSMQVHSNQILTKVSSDWLLVCLA